MGHGVNIGLGKIGHASPVKWDNARLPCTAHHPIALYLASHSSLYHSKSAHQFTDKRAPHSPLLSPTAHCTERSRPLFPHFPQLSRWSTCKDGAVQSFDSIPGFTRRVHGVNLNTNTVLVECVKRVFTRSIQVVTPRSASAECSRFYVGALTSGQFLADTPISVLSVMFH